ncbi:MAG TPA: glycine cleavage system protein GcvH [Candidatus Ruania gallistercoris]|uniref:Glycine cleavage system H protein n=1 Tax=Candidatus Ruania gallistercoris TaxID=2838746 RepID=A0A9D2EHC8_9MICO|nr:glycine cleavage system protein GcvH [Candidatus Ruania gallistercoris]
MSLPTDRQYTAEHEWVQISGDVARVGVTDYAASSLGDVVYLDLPEAGSQITASETCGEIESTKSVSDLYAPATGEVLEVNQDAVDNPEVVNTDPFGAGWLFTVRTGGDTAELLDADAYTALTQS